MIHRLRVKFILIAMLSLTLVLLVIVGGANFINYRDVVVSADEILYILSENDGRFPDFTNPDDGKPSAPPDMQFNNSPEVAYESRFFSVVLKDDGQVVSSDTGKIAAIDTTAAISMSKSVFNSGETTGFSDNYRFKVTSMDDGYFRIIFYDCNRSLENFRSFRNISLAASGVGLVAVFAMVVFLSGIAFKPAEESYEKQKRFITDAGHELKTPLAIINADSDVLEMDLGENEWVSDIKNQVVRLSELTNDLITLSKLEEGNDSLKFEENNLSELISGVVESFETSVSGTSRSIHKDIAPDIMFRCDGKSMKQVASIVMGNAVKYSPEGDTIEVCLSRKGNGWKFTVSNGTENEISKEDLKHIFDRFYRTDKSRNSDTGGYGIGLSIAKTVIEAHGGKISAGKDSEGRFYIQAVCG